MTTSHGIIHSQTRRSLTWAAGLLVLSAIGSESAANQGGFQIGGPGGVVIGGGEGLRIGGSDGVQFGGGQGAKFGGPNGVQFGGGKGAKFGGPDGVQFGGGAGAKFGPVQIGPVQIGSGQIGGQGGDSHASRAASGAPILIHYPAEANEPLDFTLNDWQFTLPPGETVQLRSDRLWIIRFARGRGASERRYSLPPGSYTFKQRRGGWDLARDKLEPAAPGPPPPPSQIDQAASDK